METWYLIIALTKPIASGPLTFQTEQQCEEAATKVKTDFRNADGPKYVYTSCVRSTSYNAFKRAGNQ